MTRWAFCCFALAGPVLAGGHEMDQFPVLGHVANVAADDLLNIRMFPEAGSEIYGTLAPDQRDIEIVTQDDNGTWGLVNSGEGSGWVHLNYIDIPDQPKWHSFERALSCYGAEPFWDFTLDVGAKDAVYVDYESQSTAYNVDWTSDIAARVGGIIGLGAGDVQRGFSALIENQMCHDGMSDRESALRIRLFLHQDGSSYGLDGCCNIVP